MTWQLAVVVLVPLIGGFKLDEKFHTSPLLTIIGFVLAMAGTAAVLWRMSQTVSQIPLTPHKGAK
jgi:F0F1-type ATP synthase assembly protein I